jgi:hypothetical protein
MKLDLLTNATVVDDAIKFVQQSKDKLMARKATCLACYCKRQHNQSVSLEILLI